MAKGSVPLPAHGQTLSISTVVSRSLAQLVFDKRRFHQVPSLVPTVYRSSKLPSSPSFQSGAVAQVLTFLTIP